MLIICHWLIIDLQDFLCSCNVVIRYIYIIHIMVLYFCRVVVTHVATIGHLTFLGSTVLAMWLYDTDTSVPLLTQIICHLQPSRVVQEIQVSYYLPSYEAGEQI